MWVYVDIACFTVDYVQASKSSECSGHSANTPCTMCAVRCVGAAGTGSAGSNHTSMSASPDLRLTRSLERLLALHKQELTATELKFLGLKKNVKEEPASCFGEDAPSFCDSDMIVTRSIAGCAAAAR